MIVIDMEMPESCSGCPFLQESMWCTIKCTSVLQHHTDFVHERLPDCPIKEVKLPENEWEVTKVPCYITVSDGESEWTEKAYDVVVYRPSESAQDDLSD